MIERPGSETTAQVVTFIDGAVSERSDRVVTEEPLEIRLSIAGASRTVAITMRTPGADFELAVGFLFGEGVIARREQIVGISYCKDDDLPQEQLFNIVIIELDPTTRPDLRPLERHFVTSSACGVCGKASLDALELRGVASIPAGPRLEPATVAALPDRLRSAQGVFDSTGGLHAAGIFDPDGEVVTVREDVGRHNAVDKLIGWAVLQNRLPLTENVVMVSGRSSYEILQKCLSAGVPIVCSVSAPSSLAVDVAARFGMTLIGFVRGSRFNVYAGPERIKS